MMSDKDFEITVGKNRQRLVSLALHFLKNKEDAEDAAQEVLLRLWLFRSSLRHGKNIDGLLTTMMRNHCVSKLRKVSPLTVPLEQCDADTGGNALQWLEEKQNNELLRKAVASPSRTQTIHHASAGRHGNRANRRSHEQQSAFRQCCGFRRKTQSFQLYNQQSISHGQADSNISQ